MVSELSTLIHNLVLDNPVPAKDLAKAIGKPYSTLLREVNPYDTGAKLGAETLLQIMLQTGDTKPLEYMAGKLGYALVSSRAEAPHVTPGAFQAQSVPGEKDLNGSRRAPKGARWHVICFSSDGEDEIAGIADFSGRITGKTDRKSIFYACATLKADSRMENMILKTGSCGKLRVWINGVPVSDYDGGRRACIPDTDSVEGITLREGLNRIVVKYMDNDGDYIKERKFSLRFTDTQRRPYRIR